MGIIFAMGIIFSPATMKMSGGNLRAYAVESMGIASPRSLFALFKVCRVFRGPCAPRRRE